jgi:Protein of unknown function (DUF2795)
MIHLCVEGVNQSTCEDGNDIKRWMIMTKANPVELQKHLKGVDYPAGKEELIEHAREQGADKQLISLLEQLPDDDEYENPTDLNKAIGEIQ